MKKLRIIVLILCACIILTGIKTEVAVAANEAKATTFRLEKVEGTAKVINAKGKSMSLTDGMQLYSGDTVQTDEKSYAYVSLDGSKLIKLEELSQAVIKKSGKKLEIKLEEGALYFEVNSKLANDESMTIGTSNVSLSIRGTAGVVKKRNINDSIHDTVWLLDGQVELSGIGAAAGRETITIWGGERVDYIENSGAWKRDLINIMEIPGFADVTMRENAGLMNNIYELSGLDTEWIVANAEVRLTQDQELNERQYGNIFERKQKAIPAPKPESEQVPSQAPVSIGNTEEVATAIPTSIPDRNTEVMPTSVPDSNPEATPTSIPDSNPDPTPTSIPDDNPDPTPTSVPEEEPTATPTTTPEEYVWVYYWADGEELLYEQYIPESEIGVNHPKVNPEKAGYQFIGWEYFGYDDVMDGYMYYAQYEKVSASPTATPEPTEVTLFFWECPDYPDGDWWQFWEKTVHLEAGQTIYDVDYLPSDEPSAATGYRFLGWRTDDNENFYAEYIALESEATPSPTATPEATPTAVPEATPTVTPEATPSPTPTEAPMVKYVVRFYDWDGITILDEQNVMHGQAATPPADPVREGYKFVGWIPEISAITQDTIFIAQYEAGTDG